MILLKLLKNRQLLSYTGIFFSLLTLVIIASLNINSRFILFILFAFVGIAGIFVASETKKTTIIAIILCMPWLLTSFVSRIIMQYNQSITGEMMMAILYIGFVIILIIRHLVYARKVTSDLLFGQPRSIS
jgi:hypothetical protein